VSKKAIIITDGTESINLAAKEISGKLDGCKAKIIKADKFSPETLLPADIFFIGCENPKPSSFNYLEDVLLHINLAKRECGIFSPNEKTLVYLKKILKDCEAEVKVWSL
jgi:hypothetical protein